MQSISAGTMLSLFDSHSLSVTVVYKDSRHFTHLSPLSARAAYVREKLSSSQSKSKFNINIIDV